MNEQTELTVIRRKAGAGRLPSESCGMSPAKAFRLAISKAAEDELQLAAKVLGVSEKRLAQAPLLESLGGDALLILLEGPKDLKGVAVFDPQFLAAVIESQTTGQVTHAAARVRPPTRTDSAMCETILDRILQEFEACQASEPSASWVTGFRFGAQVENTRLLGLMLADIPYRSYTISLDLANGAKQGELLIALPVTGQGVSKPGCGAGGSAAWTQTMASAVNASRAEITAVLHRMQVPLAEASDFAVGDVLQVPQSALAKVSLEGSDGQVVGAAKLGQERGFRALRLNGSAGAQELAMALAGADAAMPAPAMAPMGDMPDIIDGLPDMPMAPMGEMAVDPVGADEPLGDLPMADLPMNAMEEGDADGLTDEPASEPLEIPMAAMPMDIAIE